MYFSMKTIHKSILPNDYKGTLLPRKYNSTRTWNNNEDNHLSSLPDEKHKLILPDAFLASSEPHREIELTVKYWQD